MISRTRTISRTRSSVLGVLGLSVLLAGCGGGTSEHAGMSGGEMSSGQMSSGQPSSTASATPSTDATVDPAHNDQDVAFAQQMSTHHRAALEMAALVPDRSSDEQVRSLAAGIVTAQQAELDTMSSWLTAWGQPTDGSTSSMSDMPGMTSMPTTTGMPTMTSGMPGMMSAEQMADLRAATGTAFDQEFLRLMIVHHQGAVEMARTEQAQGSNPQALALAQSIVTSQSAEIDRMNQLLTTLG